MKDRERKLDNVAAIGEIATGIRESEKERDILRDYADGKITGKEADERLLEAVREKHGK